MASPAATVTDQTNQSMEYLQDWADSSNSAGSITIETLPAELVNEIMSHLRPHDLTKLARVTKKYCEFAQSALWSNIELHRQDVHQSCFNLSVRNHPRVYLDEQFLDSWSYRGLFGVDYEFERRNAKFATAIRKLYRTAGKSKAWSKIAPLIRHLCLTVTYKSPPHVWNMILSLPNLTSIEVIGEHSSGNAPPAFESVRRPAANNVCDIRLRGYIPRKFVSAICTSSASSITSLDLGILEPAQVFEGDAEEQEMQAARGYPIYMAPRGTLWYQGSSRPLLNSLTHLLLCKRGAFDGPPDMSGDEDFEIRDDETHDLEEIKQWASLLQSVRPTVVEVILEQRPICLDYLLTMDMGISPHDEADFTTFLPGFDEAGDFNTLDLVFYRHILKDVFDNGDAWPKLRKVTFRGIDLGGFEKISGEAWSTFTARVLPGVQIECIRGNWMFFSKRKGTIMNQHGVDGLMPHLDMNEVSDEEGWFL